MCKKKILLGALFILGATSYSGVTNMATDILGGTETVRGNIPITTTGVVEAVGMGYGIKVTTTSSISSIHDGFEMKLPPLLPYEAGEVSTNGAFKITPFYGASEDMPFNDVTNGIKVGLAKGISGGLAGTQMSDYTGDFNTGVDKRGITIEYSINQSGDLTPAQMGSNKYEGTVVVRAKADATTGQGNYKDASVVLAVVARGWGA